MFDVLSRLFPDRLAGRIAVLAGAVMAGTGALYATRPDIQPDRVETTVEHTILVLLASILVLTIPATVALGRRAGSLLGRRAATAAVIGQAALAATCTASNVNGGDPAWFVVAAPLSNLLWAGGWIGLAVALWRSGAVARGFAAGLPLCWVALLPLSSLGGALLAGGFWLTLGTLMAAGTLRRSQAHDARAAAAAAA
ncbi:MAG TPA: hypothetical protein PKD59_10125 [Miltoncostaeaceae bacterium]|nr:hypothetical protein [Miltoncostaeaceae bacterium]